MTGEGRPSDAARLARLEGIPRDSEGPVFRAPWEAQAFGLTLALHARGVFSWQEWTEALSAEIRAATSAHGPDDGSRYYQCWLAALEKLVVSKGEVAPDDLALRKDEWDRAARATPHGKPIELPGRSRR